MTHRLRFPARSFLQALQPLLRRLNTERTLSSGKLGVLGHVAEQGPATTSELATVVRVNPQAISLAARELERRGFVARVQDVTDRAGKSSPTSPRRATAGLTGRSRNG